MAAASSPNLILKSATWNVLCETYANHPDSVAKFRNANLDGFFSKREPGIVQSIIAQNAETVHLQEVSQRAFIDLQVQLGRYGYKGYFAQHKAFGETRRADHGAVFRSDGVAVFFKEDTFNRMLPQTYYDPIVGRACLIVTGTHTPTNQKVQIASAHIDGNPRDFLSGDAQLGRYLDEMEKTQGVALRILGADLNQAVQDSNLPPGHDHRIEKLAQRGYSTPNLLYQATEFTPPRNPKEIRHFDYLLYKREAGVEEAVTQDLSPDTDFSYSDHSMVVSGIRLPSASQGHQAPRTPVALDDTKGDIPLAQDDTHCLVQ